MIEIIERVGTGRWNPSGVGTRHASNHLQHSPDESEKLGVR
jgi:hypothetical protein